MAKRQIEIVIEETVKYQRSAVIETDLNESSLHNLLDIAERYEHPEDALFAIERQGVKVIKRFDNYYGSPMNSELEIIDYMEVNND